MTKNNKNHKKPGGKPQEIRRLEVMAEMERLICAGHSHSAIKQWLGISKSTYGRYLRQLFEEDRETLQSKREEDILSIYAVLKARLSELYMNAYKIAASDHPSATVSEKLQAMEFCGNTAIAITKISIEAPVMLFLKEPGVQDRRLRLNIRRDPETGAMIARTPEEERAEELQRQEEQDKFREKKKPLFLPVHKLDDIELARRQREVQAYEQQQGEEDQGEDNDE